MPRYVPEDMPLSGWSRPTGLLNYPDCSPEGLGIPDLGEVNVTFPDTKVTPQYPVPSIVPSIV